MPQNCVFTTVEAEDVVGEVLAGVDKDETGEPVAGALVVRRVSVAVHEIPV